MVISVPGPPRTEPDHSRYPMIPMIIGLILGSIAVLALLIDRLFS